MSIAGPKSVPITLKLSSFGTDIELQKYTNFTVKELLEEVSSISGVEMSKLRLKVVEEMQTRRLDTQMYLKETMTLPDELRVLNTLHDVKLGHNSILTVEEKSDEELTGEEAGVAANADVELLDDSDNARTVIANVNGYEEH